MLVAAGVLLAAANGTWLGVAVRDTPTTISVGGAAAAPALNGLALAAVACVGALSIASRVLRYLLAGMLALLGAAAALLPWPVLADPVSGAERTVSSITGISGSDSVRALVTRAEPTAWPLVAVVAGVAIIAAAVGVAVTARAWPGSGRRYGGGGDRTPPDPWDALSRGSDPTGGPEQ